MDELEEFCARVLGDRERAARAAEQARRGGENRLRGLAQAVVACRDANPSSGNGAQSPSAAEGGGGDAAEGECAGELSLAEAVSGELARASARLPLGQREALALRRLGCSHAELATVLGIEPGAVAPLLARARLRLRFEIRGGEAGSVDCPERERALRTIALRQDHEQVPDADDDWLLEHLGHCVGCGQVHAAMLEAWACYRAWRVAPAPAP
jgi:sigma-70-like protein